MIWIANHTQDPIACPKEGCPDIEPGQTHRDTEEGKHVIEETGA